MAISVIIAVIAVIIAVIIAIIVVFVVLKKSAQMRSMFLPRLRLLPSLFVQS